MSKQYPQAMGFVVNRGTPQADIEYRCPECGHTADLDNWDILGADGDCLFCTNCSLMCELDGSAAVAELMAEIKA